MIRTVDTDVFLLAISLYDRLNLEQLWIDFGSGKQRCYLPIHKMVLDTVKRNGLRFFFAFTGCDQVSFFAHVSKVTSWKIWSLYPNVSEASDEDIERSLPVLERFTVLLYTIEHQIVLTLILAEGNYFVMEGRLTTSL